MSKGEAETVRGHVHVHQESPGHFLIALSSRLLGEAQKPVPCMETGLLGLKEMLMSI